MVAAPGTGSTLTTRAALSFPITASRFTVAVAPDGAMASEPAHAGIFSTRERAGTGVSSCRAPSPCRGGSGGRGGAGYGGAPIFYGARATGAAYGEQGRLAIRCPRTPGISISGCPSRGGRPRSLA